VFFFRWTGSIHDGKDGFSSVFYTPSEWVILSIDQHVRPSLSITTHKNASRGLSQKELSTVGVLINDQKTQLEPGTRAVPATPNEIPIGFLSHLNK